MAEPFVRVLALLASTTTPPDREEGLARASGLGVLVGARKKKVESRGRGRGQVVEVGEGGLRSGCAVFFDVGFCRCVLIGIKIKIPSGVVLPILLNSARGPAIEKERGR